MPVRMIELVFMDWQLCEAYIIGYQEDSWGHLARGARRYGRMECACQAEHYVQKECRMPQKL